MPGPYTRHALVVCPAASQAQANAWALAHQDPLGGADTFTVPLTADGTTTWGYWAAFHCDQPFWDTLASPSGPVATLGGQLFDLDVTTPDAVLAQLDLSRLQGARP